MPSILNRSGSFRASSVSSKEQKCTVQLLDDEQTISVEFKKDALGQFVLDYVCEMLNLAEKDYFGLRYVDTNRHRYWLDTSKPISRQIKSGTPIVFAFRVRYYPVDPSVVHEQLTRYLITLQLKRDLLHGRLYCPQNDAAILGSYIVQGELGDYDPNVHTGNYVSQFKMFLNQTPRLEERIMAEHQKLRAKGLTPSDGDTEFLRKASTLDTYGYYPFTVKDAKNGQVYVGATPRGLLIYQAHKKLHHLEWADVRGFDYSGKDFYIYTSEAYYNEHGFPEESFHDHGSPKPNTDDAKSNGTTDESKTPSKRKGTLHFICPSATFCKHLWKYMLGQEAFFTKEKAVEVKPVVIRRGPLLRRSTFRYSGRVLQEIKESSSPKRPEPTFERIHLVRQLSRDERNAPWANKFHTLPRSIKAVPEERSIDDILNRTTPNVLNVTRESLLLETTSQSSPITTPMAGLSPQGENGPSFSTFANGTTLVKYGHGPNGAAVMGNANLIPIGTSATYSAIMQQTTTTTTKQTSSNGGIGGSQSEVITVCLKRVQPSGVAADMRHGHEIADQLLASTQATQRRTVQQVVGGGQQLQQQTKIENGNVGGGHGIEQSSMDEFEDEEDESEQRTSSPYDMATDQHRRPIAQDSIGLALLPSILTGFMFLILIVATVVMVMEIQDGDFRRYISHATYDDSFRRHIYDPVRQRLVDVYGRTFK